MIGMQYAFMQDDSIATHLSSMINDDQLVSNLKAVKTSPDVKVSTLHQKSICLMSTVWSKNNLIIGGVGGEGADPNIYKCQVRQVGLHEILLILLSFFRHV